MTFVVVLEEGEDGFIVAECPVLPGCVSQGKTREDALADIREAIQGVIEVRRKHSLPIPQETVVEVELPASLPVVSGREAVNACAKIGFVYDHGVYRGRWRQDATDGGHQDDGSEETLADPRSDPDAILQGCTRARPF